ncbi:MAG: glutamyl-tRNA reductase [Candidatus Wallbacteria bacterium]
MNILAVGLNYKTSDIKTRETFSLTKDNVSNAIFNFMKFPEILECVIISTCNRFEIYIAAGGQLNEDNFIRAIFNYFNINEDFEAENIFYILKNKNAVTHLLSVSCGLDSMILGEDQILGQVKSAYSAAVKADSTSAILNKLFHCAIRTAKKIKTEINLTHKVRSIGAAAINLICKELKIPINEAEIVLIGAGEIAEAAFKNLLNLKPKKISILNRTIENAEKLYLKYFKENQKAEYKNTSIEILPLDNIYCKIDTADAAISAAGTQNYIVDYGTYKKNLKNNKLKKPLVITDLGIPRNIDPAIGTIENISLFNIDDIKKNNGSSLENELTNEIVNMKKIIETESESFIEWFDKISIMPFIANFRSMVEKIVTSQTRRFSDKLNNSDISEETAAELKKSLRACATAIINQLTAPAITKIRNCSNSKDISKCVKTIECVLDMNDCSKCKTANK